MVHRQEQDSLMQAAPVYPPQSFNVRHLSPSSAVVDFNNKSPSLEFHTKGNLYLVNQTRIIFVLSQKGFMRKIQIVIWEKHLSYIKRRSVSLKIWFYVTNCLLLNLELSERYEYINILNVEINNKQQQYTRATKTNGEQVERANLI